MTSGQIFAIYLMVVFVIFTIILMYSDWKGGKRK